MNKKEDGRVYKKTRGVYSKHKVNDMKGWGLKNELGKFILE